MITGSGKQNDKEVETSIVHFMQMYTFDILRYFRSKNIITQPLRLSLPGIPTDDASAQAFASYFSSSVQLPCGRARKM